ncbi:MAG: DUF4131 domain-containing protein, partial [Acetobacteraceae bacterium]|nr:DUF4131 domain-containing protein [Acetobacteraceae bacterium]
MQSLAATLAWRSRSLAPWLAGVAAAERDRAVLWLPVFMGAGVLAYYTLRFEPAVWFGAAATSLAAAGAFATRRLWLGHAAFLAIAAVAAGFAAAQFATARALPLETGLPSRAVMVTGLVRALEILPEGRRITIEHVQLGDAQEPLRRDIRIRLRNTDHTELATGDTVRVRALVRLPAPPAYPGAWDLQRDAFYTSLGGSGFALGAMEVTAHAAPATAMRFVQWLRETIAARVAAEIPGAAGQVAVTLLTGASSGIPEADHAAFRDSG